LIQNGFVVDPDFLWITLLKSCRYPSPGLENQGFPQNARQKSSKLNQYKSMTYDRYWFYSDSRSSSGPMAHRNSAFVHK
jgi:hypothetical protein